MRCWAKKSTRWVGGRAGGRHARRCCLHCCPCLQQLSHGLALPLTWCHRRRRRPLLLPPLLLPWSARPAPQALVATSLKQKEARQYEEAEAGRYKPSGQAAALQGDAAALAAEAERARSRQERLRAAVEGVAAVEAGAGGPAAAVVVSQLERVLAHAAAVQCEVCEA